MGNEVANEASWTSHHLFWLLNNLTSQPAAFAAHHFNVYTGDADKEHTMKFAKGTTTLAFRYKGGVIVAVDSRSTQGPYIGESPLLPPCAIDQQ